MYNIANNWAYTIGNKVSKQYLWPHFWGFLASNRSIKSLWWRKTLLMLTWDVTERFRRKNKDQEAYNKMKGNKNKKKTHTHTETEGRGLGLVDPWHGWRETEWMKDGEKEAMNEREIEWDRGWKDGGGSWTTTVRLVPEIFYSTGTEVKLISSGAPSSQGVVAFLFCWVEDG